MKNTREEKDTINLYTNTGWKSLFARIRFWDSPYREVEKLIPDRGIITELGCGEGIFSNFLGMSSVKRNVVGIEIDKDRVGDADRGLKNVFFKKADALKVMIPKSNCIVMFHLLHHLNSFKDQELLLEKSKGALKKKGKLVIVEIVEKPLIKFLTTWFTDYFVVPWLFEGKFIARKIYFRKEKDWKIFLRNTGFKVKTFTPHHGKPFSHAVFVCERGV